MSFRNVTLRYRVELVGAIFLLSTLACSFQGLGAVQPTPTLFVLPTLPPSPTATLFAEETVVPDVSLEEVSHSTDTVDVCALYTKEDLQTIYSEPEFIGVGLILTAQGTTSSYLCTYSAEASPIFGITVTPNENVDAAVATYQKTKMIFGIAQPISDLGDEALFDLAMMGAGSSLAVRQGTFVVNVSISFDEEAEGASGQPMDEETQLQLTQSIMQTILPRLPHTAAPADSEPGNTQVTPTISPVLSGELDPCALYTQAEIEALFGEQAAIRVNEPAPDDTGTVFHTCTYGTKTGYGITIAVAIYDSTDQAIAGYQKFNAMYDLTSISGLGDEAGYAEVNMFGMATGMFTRQGTMLVNVWVADVINDLGTPAPATDPATRSQRAQDIMKTVLSRLPK